MPITQCFFDMKGCRYILLISFTSCFLVCTKAQQDSLYFVDRPSWTSMAYDEYAPVAYRDMLVFIANRSTGGIFRFSHQETDKPLDNYFCVSKKTDSTYTSLPKVFARELVSGSSKGAMVFNKNGTKMYLCKNIIEPGRFRNFLGADNKVGIFESSQVGGRWTKPVLITAINVDGYNTAHPALSPDEKRLYFASDRPGGYGQMDIWYSDFVKGQWTAPKNMGSVVNSPNNEVFPVCNANGRIYFSSNRPDRTTGKLDIFYTEFLNGEWIAPVHLPAPFNSRYNDFCIETDPGLDRGFFCSDRNDHKTSNIYSFRSTIPLFVNPEPLKTPRLCYTFFENNGVIIDTTFAMYEWDFGEEGKVQALEAYHCFPGPGVYNIDLNVIEKLTKKVRYHQATYTFPIDKIEQPWIDSPDSVNVNDPVAFSGENSYFVSFKPKKYYWDFGDGDKAMGIQVNHRFLKSGIYTVRLGIIGIDEDSDKLVKHASYKNIIVRGDYTLSPAELTK